MSDGIGCREATELLAAEGSELFELLVRAGRVRLERRGRAFGPCAIVNAKSGICGQDCAFCAQSSRSEAKIDRYRLKPPVELFESARKHAEAGALRVSLVTSGGAASAAELAALGETIARMARELPASPCASLGLLERDALTRLAAQGLTRYHHNLESAESFFAQICTTRSWHRSVETIAAAKGTGLEVCCGGIFGLGESLAQRVELLESIRQLEVDSVPLNFLHPIPGTPLSGMTALQPLECVRVIAVARLMMPDSEIRVCGGRELNLRDLQSWVLFAGADGFMVGGYLTTGGRTVADDLRMIEDAGFEVRGVER